MQPVKIADTVSPEVDLEHLRCCISSCCIRKQIINFTRYIKYKTKSFVRFTTL